MRQQHVLCQFGPNQLWVPVTVLEAHHDSDWKSFSKFTLRLSGRPSTQLTCTVDLSPSIPTSPHRQPALFVTLGGCPCHFVHTSTMSLTTGRFSLPIVACRVKLSGRSTSQKPRLGLVTTPTTRTSFRSASLPNLARGLCGHRPPSRPRRLSTVGFETLNSSQPIEEETFAWYDLKYFYPARIGEVFQTRYQVIGKLGYGAYSTVWLCKDLV